MGRHWIDFEGVRMGFPTLDEARMFARMWLGHRRSDLRVYIYPSESSARPEGVVIPVGGGVYGWVPIVSHGNPVNVLGLMRAVSEVGRLGDVLTYTKAVSKHL